jgi:hypothetical protein
MTRLRILRRLIYFRKLRSKDLAHDTPKTHLFYLRLRANDLEELQEDHLVEIVAKTY